MMRLFVFLLLSACSADTFAIGDGGTTNESGGDAVVDADGDSCASFCAQTANMSDAVCADWDEPDALKPWTMDISSGGTLKTSANEATSCTLSLESSMPAVLVAPVAGTTTHALAVDVFANGGKNRIVVAFDIFLPDGLTGNFSTYLTLRADSTILVDGVSLEQHGDGLWFFVLHVGGMVPSGGNVAITPLTNAWNHMTLDVTFAMNGAGKAGLSYIGTNGSPAPQAMITNDTVNMQSALAKPSLLLGVSAPGTTTETLTAYYDNVAVSLD